MNFKPATLPLAAMAVLWISSCDRPKPVTGEAPVKPTSQTAMPGPVGAAPQAPAPPTAVIAQVNSPATQPVSTTLYLHVFERLTSDDPGILYPFPRARLHINSKEHTAVLYSDDPKTAVDPDYAGNSFYLVIPLDKDLHLDNYQWDSPASSGDQQSSTDGIFLDGQRIHLQPSDMHVAFKIDGAAARFSLWGGFVKYDSKSHSPHLGFDVKVLSGPQPLKLDTGP